MKGYKRVHALQGWKDFNRSCPYCGEYIKKYHRKCSHCGKHVKNRQGKVFPCN